MRKCDAYSHRALVDEKSVQLLSGLRRSVRSAECHLSDASARAILVVGHHYPLDGAC